MPPSATAQTVRSTLGICSWIISQNRDSRAVHLKLDELIRAVQTARNEMVGLEDLSDADLDALQHEFARLREHAERKLHTIQEHRNRRRQPAGYEEKKDVDGGT